MRITRYIPENLLLKPFIAGIYLLERNDEEPESYLSFPGIYQFVTINREVACRINDHKVTFIHKAGHRSSSLLIANFGEPHLWSYHGPILEWNICFKPLGLHHFVDSSLVDFSRRNISAGFNPFIDFEEHVNKLFSLSEHKAQVHLIEDYWLSKLKDFRHPFLHKLIHEVIGNSDRLNFSDLALRFKISRNTLHTAFKRYVGTSPARFEKVYRFRNALTAYRLSGKSSTLTNIAGEAAYFDQSHMIRDFKSFTGFTPKDLYKKITSFQKGEMSWAFI
jgi:AraC-like DNA-binding protein